MKPIFKNLGKVGITVNGYWDINNEYEKLSLVFHEEENITYISKIDVPTQINIDNTDYWYPMINFNIFKQSLIDGEFSELNTKIDELYGNLNSLKKLFDESLHAINTSIAQLNLTIINYNIYKGSNLNYTLNNILTDSGFITRCGQGTILTFKSDTNKFVRYQFIGTPSYSALTTVLNWRLISGATYGIKQSVDKNKVQISTTGEAGGIKDIINITGATSLLAGVMTAADKNRLDNLGETIIYDDSFDLDNYKNFGVYNVIGERTNINDNLPISDIGYIGVRLYVVSDFSNNCITQFLILSDNTTNNGDTYIRTFANNIWSNWGKLQKEFNVGFIDNFDNFTTQGIYTGVFQDTINDINDVFILTVINNNNIKNLYNYSSIISQYKYSVDNKSNVSMQYRIGNGDDVITWTSWKSIGGNGFNFYYDEELNKLTLY